MWRPEPPGAYRWFGSSPQDAFPRIDQPSQRESSPSDTSARRGGFASFVACGSAPAQEGAELFEERCAVCHTPAGHRTRSGTPACSRNCRPRAIVADARRRGHAPGRLRHDRGAADSGGGVPDQAELRGRGDPGGRLRCADPEWTGIDPAAVSWMGFAGNLAGYRLPARRARRADRFRRAQSSAEMGFRLPRRHQHAHLARRGRRRRAGGRTLRRGGGAGSWRPGCARWNFEADAAVRGAIVVGEGPRGTLHRMVRRLPGGGDQCLRGGSGRAGRCCGSTGSDGTRRRTARVRRRCTKAGCTFPSPRTRSRWRGTPATSAAPRPARSRPSTPPPAKSSGTTG